MSVTLDWSREHRTDQSPRVRHSAAMAPLDHQSLTRLIQAYDELLAERDQLMSTAPRHGLEGGIERGASFWDIRQ